MPAAEIQTDAIVQAALADGTSLASLKDAISLIMYNKRKDALWPPVDEEQHRVRYQKYLL